MKRIKKIILSALLAVSALSISASAAANVSYTDFSSSDAPANWQLTDGAYTIKDGAIELSTTAAWLNLPTPRPSGTVVVEYDVKIDTSSYFKVYLNHQGGVSVCNIIAGYGNKIRVQHGNQGSTTVGDVTLASNVAKDKWYHIKHVINCRAADMNTANGTTSSVYLYNEEGSLINSKEDMYYMNNTTKNSHDSMYAIGFIGYGTGVYQVDNVVVYEDTEESVLAANELACKIDNADAIKDDIKLFAGYGDATVAWKSSNSQVVADSGKVTRAREEKKVTLTATISYKETTKTLTFPLTVCPVEQETVANVNYTDFSSSETPANWKLIDGAYTIKEGVIELSPNANLHYLNLPKPVPTGNVVVEYDVKRNDNNNVVVYLQSSDGASVCRLLVGYGNKFRFQHGTIGSDITSYVDVAPVVKGEWYHVKHVLNCRPADANTAEGSTSSVYIYDEDGELIGFAEDKYYMQNVKYYSSEALTAVGLQFATNNTGTVQIDNVAVYENTDVSVWAINELACAIPDADAIKDDIALFAGYGGATVSWESSNPDVIANDGTVTKSLEEAEVTLTATISYNDTTKTLVFPVTVASGAHDVEADIYVLDFDDNTVPAGVVLNNTDGYAGVRNNRIELEKPNGTEVKVNPQATINLDKMQYGTFSGEVFIEYDFVSTADSALLGFVQALPNVGSLARVSTKKERELVITTGGDGETIENTTKVMSIIPGKKYKVKILIDYNNKKSSVYIDGKAIVEKHNFMKDVESPGYLQNISFQHSGTKGAVAIDNVVIYRSDIHSSIIATQAMLDIENDTITDDIILPTEGCNGTNITWASGNADLLTNDGKLLDTPAEDTKIELTAMLEKNGYSITKTFEVTAPAVEEPEKAVIEDAVLTSDFYGNISALKQGLAATANISITKPGNSELAFSLIAASYDKEGTLKSVKWVNETSNTKRVTDSVSIEITDTADADGYVMLYAWDSVSGMVPLKGTQTFEIE